MKVTWGDVAQELLSREGKFSLPPVCLLEAGSTWMVWIKKLGMGSRRFHCPWCLACGVRPALRHCTSPSLAKPETLIYHPSSRLCCWEKHGSAGNGPWHGSRELCRGNYELVLLQATCKGHTGDEAGIFFPSHCFVCPDSQYPGIHVLPVSCQEFLLVPGVCRPQRGGLGLS